MLLEQYDLLFRQMEELMEQVAEELNKAPWAKAILSMPCVGVVTVADFYAEIGDLAGYDHPQQIIRLCWIQPEGRQLRQHKGKTMITKRGRSRLHRILYQTTLIMVAKDPTFKVLHRYFTTRQENPLKKKQSLIALCGKLVRILFTVGDKATELRCRQGTRSLPGAQLQTA